MSSNTNNNENPNNTEPVVDNIEDNLAETDGKSSIHSLPVTLTTMKIPTPCILKTELSKDSPKISTTDLSPEMSVQRNHSRGTSSHSALESNGCNSSVKTRTTPLLHNFSVEGKEKD
jgi:hypothetical protein